MKIRNYLLIFFALVVPSILIISSLMQGNISFWYDPARDLLTAWDKFTLIGPTSGIPGIFYGAYWMWLLRFGLFFSKDPIVVILITATIPYLFLFSFIWFRFTKFFGLTPVVIGWILFILGSGMVYATGLWNPYPAPLLTLAIIYFLITIPFEKTTKAYLSQNILLGFLLGVVINFHISFGITLLFGVLIFLSKNLFMEMYKAKQKRFKQILPILISYGAISVGFTIAYLPTILFEIRHGFAQTNTLITALFKYGDVVTFTGLSKTLILQEFFIALGKILHITPLFAAVLLFLSLSLLLFFVKTKKIILTRTDWKILTILAAFFTGVIGIYFTAKNPIWSYHFIGVDILFLILVTFLLAKLPIMRKIAIFGVIFIIGQSFYSVATASKQPTSLERKKEIVATIAKDAGRKTDYAVFAYSPSIYTYDYSYLFKWLVGKEIPYDPGLVKPADTMYLILPTNEDTKATDFLHYHAPENVYKKVATWIIPNGGAVVKVIRR